MRVTGSYQDSHFIPYSLPPKDPPFILEGNNAILFGQAMLNIGKLNGMAYYIPDITRFIKAYVIKEALLSSAIEGIHTTLIDIYTQPLLESKPNKPTQLIMNYTKALQNALDLIKRENLPVSTRVILNAHKILMEIGEGDKANPGHYRKQAVKVGSLIPPSALHVPHLMSDLERYINTNKTLPPLIQAGLAHVQFETIHPFLDGNGRIGRLLIILILLENNLLKEPILYPSYYFKKYQREYYQHLDSVRTQGDFEGWITYYLKAINQSSIDAYLRAAAIERLQKEIANTIIAKTKSEKMLENRLITLKILFLYPIINVKELSLQLDMSYNSAARIIADFVSFEILVEETQQKRGKLFKFKLYFDILEKEFQD